jgi:hypothetical protein
MEAAMTELFIIVRKGQPTFMVYTDAIVAVEKAKRLNAEIGKNDFMAMPLMVDVSEFPNPCLYLITGEER